MRENLWQKRIPTLFGLILIVVGIALTTYLVGTGAIITTKAGPSEIPKDTRITNLTDNSFTVSYTTEAQVIGSLNYGKSELLDQITLDDRDENGNIAPHYSHHITAKNLEPQTQYYFSITSGSKTFTQEDGAPYKVITGPATGRSEIEDSLLKGQVIFLPSQAKEAIIYISSQDTNTISTTTGTDGKYTILLNTLRTNDLTTAFDFNETTVFNMLAIGRGGSSTVQFTIPPTKELPDIILAQNFDFTQKDQAETLELNEEGLSSLNFGKLPQSQTPQILTPSQNQEFIDSQPRFSGTASPNSVVNIEIHSDNGIKTQVTVDSRGNWIYRPVSPLPPGKHTITISARDASGILRTIIRTFTVFESGTQVAESATPSATPIPTLPATTATPTPSPGVPVLTPTPTPLPVVTPVVTTSPIPPPVEPPGVSLTLLGIIGIGITGLGLFILLGSRSASV